MYEQIAPLDTAIPQKALDQTTECHRDFCCLAPNGAPACKASYVDGPNMVFLAPSEERACCCYQMALGDRSVCRCPTRYALHRPHRT